MGFPSYSTKTKSVGLHVFEKLLKFCHKSNICSQSTQISSLPILCISLSLIFFCSIMINSTSLHPSCQSYTRKNLTTCRSLQTSRQQVVFARLVTSCQQLATTLLILSDLLQGCSNKAVTIMI